MEAIVGDLRGESPLVNAAEVERATRQARRAALGWVRSLPPWMDREAFVGEALLAVAVAIRRYRPEHGIPFTSYAAHKVQYALLLEARRQDPVSAWRRAKLRRGEVEQRAADQPPLSLEALCIAGRPARGWEVDPDPGPEARTVLQSERARVHAALRSLNPRHRSILYLRYWDGYSQPAVARMLGISATRIHQIERDALTKVRRRLQADGAWV